MVLVDVRDPGNAGTMIRTADAAGVGRGDPLRRVGRPHQSEDGAGLGGVGLPRPGGGRRATAGDVVDDAAGDGSSRRWAPQCADGVDYADFDWRRRVALVFGNEASGLDDALIGRLDARVSIPMVGQRRVAQRRRVGRRPVLRGPPSATRR